MRHTVSVYWREIRFSKIAIRHRREGGQLDSGTIKVVTIDFNPFLFWRISNRLLCRQGLGMRSPVQAAENSPASKQLIDDSVSALAATNVIGVTFDWTAVSDKMTDQSKWFPVVVGGKPAVILIDESKRGHPLATACRLENGEWTEFAVMDSRKSERRVFQPPTTRW